MVSTHNACSSALATTELHFQPSWRTLATNKKLLVLVGIAAVFAALTVAGFVDFANPLTTTFEVKQRTLLAKKPSDANHPLSKLLVAEALALNRFDYGFDKDSVMVMRDEKQHTRYVVKMEKSTEATDKVSECASWAKIAGKNSMADLDVQALLTDYNATYSELLKLVGEPEKMCFIFDGDNLAPSLTATTAPFTALIRRLIAHGFKVLSVKNAEEDNTLKVSAAHFEGWRELAEQHSNFMMAVVPKAVGKEHVSEKADAFFFWGSTYQSPSGKDYRFRYENGIKTQTPTQGYSEILALQERSGFRVEVLGKDDAVAIAYKIGEVDAKGTANKLYCHQLYFIFVLFLL